MTSRRITTFTVEGPVLELFVSDCANCGVVFGIPKDLERRRRDDKGDFYCPNGHVLIFGGKSDEEKLREERARNTSLQDQLSAAIRDAEATRVELLRIRSRIANGVCPCCNRSFDNVRRHMATQHPDFAVPEVATRPPFKCSCGQRFDSFRGLRTHQGHMRDVDTDSDYRWDKPDQDSWWAHLTVVS